MVADLCHFVLSCFRGEMCGANRRHAKTRKMVSFSCFRMATLRPATRKYDISHASPFRLLFLVSLPGGAKGRHAITRQNHHLACFRMATFRHARQRYDEQGRKRERPPRKTRQMMTFRVLAWRPFAPPHESTRHSMRCVFGYC